MNGRKGVVVAAAVAGILGGAGCSKSETAPVTGPAPAATTQAVEKHACAGKNSCKGKGGCKSSDNGCPAKNSCKGKGGCATDGSMTTEKK